MHRRITRYGLAVAGLFVLAGVGLGSLLSPLVGDALATVGSTVNISDNSSSAYFAKVDSAGALKTTAAVTGKVAPTPPPQPFYVTHEIKVADGSKAELTATTATVALTDLNFGNSFGNQARSVTVWEFSAPAPNAGCSGAFRTRFLGTYDVGSGETLHLSFTTPIVVKPLATGDGWCVTAYLQTPSADADNVDTLAIGGYVRSGTYSPL